jgi:putative motility protein YjfB-like
LPFHEGAYKGKNMDTSNIASQLPSIASSGLAQAVGISALKKAVDLQASDALALVLAVPPVPSLPPHLGNNINVTA